MVDDYSRMELEQTYQEPVDMVGPPTGARIRSSLLERIYTMIDFGKAVVAQALMRAQEVRGLVGRDIEANVAGQAPRHLLEGGIVQIVF